MNGIMLDNVISSCPGAPFLDLWSIYCHDLWGIYCADLCVIYCRIDGRHMCADATWVNPRIRQRARFTSTSSLLMNLP